MAGPAHAGRPRGTERSDGEGSAATLKRSRPRAASRTGHPTPVTGESSRRTLRVDVVRILGRAADVDARDRLTPRAVHRTRQPLLTTHHGQAGRVRRLHGLGSRSDVSRVDAGLDGEDSIAAAGEALSPPVGAAETCDLSRRARRPLMCGPPAGRAARVAPGARCRSPPRRPAFRQWPTTSRALACRQPVAGHSGRKYTIPSLISVTSP